MATSEQFVPDGNDTDEWHKIEYQEAASAFRNIDLRIWNIYGLYLGGCGAAMAYALTKATELTHGAIVGIALALIIASFSQMAMVGHLQWGSDQFAFRLRKIEKDQNLHSHRRYKEDHPGNLWGAHRVWHELRARDVMQWLAFLIVSLSFALPFFLPGKDGSGLPTQLTVALMTIVPFDAALIMTIGARVRGVQRLRPDPLVNA